jgi:hypothetical protein
VVAQDGGLGVAREGEFADLDLVALFPGLGLGQTDRADLRLGIGAARNAATADRASMVRDWPAGVMSPDGGSRWGSSEDEPGNSSLGRRFGPERGKNAKSNAKPDYFPLLTSAF